MPLHYKNTLLRQIRIAQQLHNRISHFWGAVSHTRSGGGHFVQELFPHDSVMDMKNGIDPGAFQVNGSMAHGFRRSDDWPGTMQEVFIQFHGGDQGVMLWAQLGKITGGGAANDELPSGIPALADVAKANTIRICPQKPQLI